MRLFNTKNMTQYKLRKQKQISSSGHTSTDNRSPKENVLDGYLEGIHSKTIAKIEIGCSQRFVVDISICHLQVSQSVTT